MRKKIIIVIVAIILVAIIAGISVIVIKNQSKQQDNSQYTNISEDTFIGTVIGNDKNQVIVIPNQNELIRQSSFEIINAVITNNTVIYYDDKLDTIDNVNIGDTIKVTFDGKIYEVKPGKVIAKKLEVIPTQD